MSEEYAAQIWNAAYDRIQAIPGFASFRKTPMLTLQGEKLPCLQCLYMRLQDRPDGDSNTAEPRFFHQFTIGFEAVIAQENAENMMDDLITAMGGINTVLLTDPTFIDLIEGFQSSDGRPVYGQRIAEIPVAMYQREMVVTYRSTWPPVIPDEYHKTTLTTRPVDLTIGPPSNEDTPSIKTVIDQAV